MVTIPSTGKDANQLDLLTLLLKMQNGTANLENRILIIYPTVPFLGFYLEK